MVSREAASPHRRRERAIDRARLCRGTQKKRESVRSRAAAQRHTGGESAASRRPSRRLVRSRVAQRRSRERCLVVPRVTGPATRRGAMPPREVVFDIYLGGDDDYPDGEDAADAGATMTPGGTATGGDGDADARATATAEAVAAPRSGGGEVGVAPSRPRARDRQQKDGRSALRAPGGGGQWHLVRVSCRCDARWSFLTTPRNPLAPAPFLARLTSASSSASSSVVSRAKPSQDILPRHARALPRAATRAAARPGG